MMKWQERELFTQLTEWMQITRIKYFDLVFCLDKYNLLLTVNFMEYL